MGGTMTSFITLSPQGRAQRLEYEWVGADDLAGSVKSAAPLIFLHEGLGSVTLWRDFPGRLCTQLGRRGLVYSRFGYGASTPRPSREVFPPDYLEREALTVLPALMAALNLQNPWLVGHSDGGSIALLTAIHDSACLSGIVVIAPHYFVEDICLRGIEKTRKAYEQGKLRERLQRYHQNVDSAFYGWNDAWLDPARRSWNIGAELEKISCPVLAIQGDADEYATLEQIEGIKRQASQTRLLVLPHCGHTPHLQAPDNVLEAIHAFIREAEQREAA
jgi:pimeloyl-ACP methyl ester carboxylesterase